MKNKLFGYFINFIMMLATSFAIIIPLGIEVSNNTQSVNNNDTQSVNHSGSHSNMIIIDISSF